MRYLFKLSTQTTTLPFFATKKHQRSILVLDSTVRPCKAVASVVTTSADEPRLVAGHTRLFTKHHALGSTKVAELQCLAFPIQQQILPPKGTLGLGFFSKFRVQKKKLLEKKQESSRVLIKCNQSTDVL